MKTSVRRLAPILLAITGLALLLTACGGPSTPAVAGPSSSTTTTSLTSTSLSAQFARFGACMRSHGEPQFQNPTANGNTIGFTVSPSLGVGTPRYARAVTECQKYLSLSAQNLISPNLPPGMQRISQADEIDYLKAVACMHAQGFPGIPDPKFVGGAVHISVPPNIDRNSAEFQRALGSCQKSIPAGLPYSGSG